MRNPNELHRVNPSPLKNNRCLLVGFGLLLGLLLTNCNRGVVFSEYQTFKTSSWSSKDTVRFNFKIEQNSDLYSVHLMVRHGASYPFDNMFVFLTTRYPKGISKTDTLELILADSKGVWLGSGMGDMFDLKIPLKTNFRFPSPGNYSIYVQQAMETDPLPEVLDIGLEVEKISK